MDPFAYDPEPHDDPLGALRKLAEGNGESDAVEYRLYHDPAAGLGAAAAGCAGDALLLGPLAERCDAYLRHAAEVGEGYLWCQDAFALGVLSTTEATTTAAAEGVAASGAAGAEAATGGAGIVLGGRLRYGDDVDDEWFVVFLLQSIARRWPDVTVSVWDNDGQFLLIEAAMELPRWIKPDNSDNRVFLRGDGLHVVPTPQSPAEMYTIPLRPTLAQALALVRGKEVATLASPGVQGTVRGRLAIFRGDEEEGEEAGLRGETKGTDDVDGADDKGDAAAIAARIAELRVAKATAVEAEEYVEAQRLKDEISELLRGDGASGGNGGAGAGGADDAKKRSSHNSSSHRAPRDYSGRTHHAHCVLPRAVARCLEEDPALVAAATRAFYLRGPDDIDACNRMAHFPPDGADGVDGAGGAGGAAVGARVRFTRCLYAQLRRQQFHPPRPFRKVLPLPHHPLFDAAELGMKVACGFEMLYDQAMRRSGGGARAVERARTRRLRRTGGRRRRKRKKR